jgi:hypothetical protein
MADIATLPEFASFLQTDVDTATSNLLLLDLAQGLIVEEIGVQNPWPTIAKSVALSAAARAYVNPEGLRQQTVGSTSSLYNTPLYTNGVFLSESEKASLRAWANQNGDPSGGPQGDFPPARAWPDPVEKCWY